MRTAAICPTCATYTNAVCVLYDGPYLSNLDIAPLTDLEEVIGIIDAKIGTLQPALGFTPENVANKSTNVSLGTSNTLYPTQNAVKTYVDTEIAAIPVPTLQQVTVAGSQTTVGMTVDDGTGTDILYLSPGQVKAYYDSSGEFVQIDKNTITFNNGNFDLDIVNPTLTAARTINIPNASGTFALSVNGNAASTTGNVSVNLQSVLNAGNSLSGGRNFQGTNAGVGSTGVEIVAFGTAAGFGNTGSYVIGFGLDAVGGNTGSEVTAFGSGAAQGNTLSGVTVFSNLTLPTYADHTAAALAITVLLGATPGCTYLYHNQATNSIGAVRL